MKQLSLLCILFCLLAGAGRAATVSGTLTANTSTGAPVAGRMVYLLDSTSTFYYKDSMLSGSSGGYAFTIPGTITSGTLKVEAIGCGYMNIQSFTYSGSSMTVNLAVCLGTVSGTVTNYTWTGPAVSGQKIYLVDSDWSHYLVDSTLTNSTGGYSLIISPSTGSGVLRAYTIACGTVYNIPFFYAGNSTINFVLCNATVSGTLSNLTTSAPVAGYKVFFLDSTASSFHRDSTVTNASGVYSINIPVNFTTSQPFVIYSQACGTRYTNTGTYSGTSSTTVNLGICSSSTATISGTVKDFYTNAAISGQKVYFIDSSSSGIVVYRDSAFSSASGGYSFTVPASITGGYAVVYTQACGSRYSSTPTVYGGYSLTMNLRICSSGTATITGTVTNATTSTPVAFYNVIFVDSNATSIVYRDSIFTNASGNYSFNIPTSITSGNFGVYVQSCGSQVAYKTTYSGGNLTANLSICSASTATASGTVLNGSTSAPISGQKVYIKDSNYLTTVVVYRDSTTTNASGQYSFVIPPSLSTANLVIGTPSCGYLMTNYSYYTGSSVVVNFNVSAPVSTLVSGYVNTAGGGALYNQKVYIVDSSAGFYFKDSTYTNFAGSYNYYLPATVSAGQLKVSVTACGVTYTNTQAYYPCTIIYYAYFWVCPGSPSYSLFGNVILGRAGANNGPTMLYLIHKKYDAAVMDTTLTVIDSFTTIGNTGTFNRTYSTHPYTTYGHTGSLLLKAALMPGHPDYASYLPTYYRDSALTWSAARTLDSFMFIGGTTYVNMKPGTNPGGPGFIGGSVLLGANKNAGVGDPLGGRMLLLTTAAGDAVAYTYSDAGGQFSFPNLAYGSYNIFGDVWGRTNPALTVTISAATPSVGNIVFEENSTSFKGHLNTLGVGGGNVLQSVRIYPNPVKAYVTFHGLSEIRGDKTAILRDITGAVISRTTIAAGSAARIATSHLPSGMYMLQLQTAEGAANFRFIKE